MYMLKYCVLMGPTLGLYEMILFKMKNFYWDRYTWCPGIRLSRSFGSCDGLVKQFRLLWRGPTLRKDMKCSRFRLVCTSGLWLEQTRQKLGLGPFSFLAANMEQGHKGILWRFWSLDLVVNAFIRCWCLGCLRSWVHLGITVLALVSFSLVGFSLWFGAQFSLLVASWELGIVAHPTLVDYLLRSHHQDATGDATMSTSIFSLRKNIFMQNQNLYLYHSY